jgi:hypothetical protein
MSVGMEAHSPIGVNRGRATIFKVILAIVI